MNSVFVKGKGVKVKGYLLILFFLVFIFHFSLHSQQSQVYKPTVNRILFVFDGSGSMKQQWSGKTKFEKARELLFKLIDSVERKNPNVEFAVRIFGYQFPREQRNCKDSKLLVPFAKNNAQKINTALNNIKPQGMSPVAYSIQLGAGDFPEDEKSLNSIILITDGEENCDGDPCIISHDLVAKRITLKPFIVGLNVDSAKYDRFKCMGTFYDTKDETSFYNTVGVIIKQTLNTTSTQVNLLDANGNPTVTNIAFTLYDHSSGKIQYNFIHTLNEKGNPDTLYLDPIGVYDLELHTYPSLRREGIELVPGKHNIIALDVPAGDFKTESAGASVSSNNAQVVLRSQKDLKTILNVQDLNEVEKYLSADYKMEILTTPEIYFDTLVVPFTENRISIPTFGTLSIMSSENLLASIFKVSGSYLQLVERIELTGKTDNRKLQPGSYTIVYKAKTNYDSESTKSKKFLIEEGRVVVINLQ